MEKTNITEPGYKLSITANGEELSGDGDTKVAGEASNLSFALPADESDAALDEVANFARAFEEPVFFADPPERCDICRCQFEGRKYFIDGKVKEDMKWAFMCSECFDIRGDGLGDGLGPLYAAMTSGEWLLVGGFPSEAYQGFD